MADHKDRLNKWRCYESQNGGWWVWPPIGLMLHHDEDIRAFDSLAEAYAYLQQRLGVAA